MERGKRNERAESESERKLKRRRNGVAAESAGISQWALLHCATTGASVRYGGPGAGGGPPLLVVVVVEERASNGLVTVPYYKSH